MNGDGRIDGLPARLQNARERFQRWRQTRRGRSRIPEALWDSAVAMARLYGVSRTAKVLRLGYYSLKKRVENETAGLTGDADEGVSESLWRARAADSGTTFLEVEVPAAPSSGSGDCLLECEDGRGAKMRVHLKGAAAPDLIALARSFWGGRS